MALPPSLKYDHSYGRRLKPYLPKESKEEVKPVKKQRKKPERNPQHRIKPVDPSDFIR